MGLSLHMVQFQMDDTILVPAARRYLNGKHEEENLRATAYRALDPRFISWEKKASSFTGSLSGPASSTCVSGSGLVGSGDDP